MSGNNVVPDDVWNQDVVENPTALRGGAIAISGQAANDLIIATSSTQLGRVAAATQGAVLCAGASGLPTWLAAGTDGQVLKSNGSGADPSWEDLTAVESKDRDVSTATLGTSTTETTLWTYTLPGGTLGTTRMLRGAILCSIDNSTAGARTVTLRLKYGSTTFGSCAVAIGVTNGAAPLIVKFWLSASGATNTQVGFAEVVGVDASAPSAGVTAVANEHHVAVHPTMAEDSTGDLAVLLTAQHSNGDSTLVTRAYITQLELV